MAAYVRPYHGRLGAAFASLYAGFAVLHLAVAPTHEAAIMAPLAAATAALGAFMTLYVRDGRRPPFVERHFTTIIGACLIANSAAHIFAAGELQHATNLAISVVACGIFVFSRIAFAASVAAAAAAFSLAAATVPGDAIHYGVHLAECSIAAALTFHLRSRVLERLFGATDAAEAARASAERLAAERQAHLDAALAADAAKTRFLATMSHELRTPLNAVIGFAKLLEDEEWVAENPALAAEYAGDVARSGEFLLGVIGGILDYAKIAEGRARPVNGTVDPAEIVSTSLSLVVRQASAKRLAIVARGAAGAPSFPGDPQMLKQALVNLLSNAIKFTPDGGSVSVDVKAEAGRIRFAVTDDGIGIAAADQARVFEPFVQIDSSLSRRHDGTGLGLTLVKAFVELHGGRVALNSRPGHGTTVTLDLPLSASAAPLSLAA